MDRSRSHRVLGFFGNPGLILVDTTSSSAAVHFVSVSEFFSESPNYFSAELGRNGRFQLRWGATARGEALVGATEGNGAASRFCRSLTCT